MYPKVSTNQTATGNRAVAEENLLLKSGCVSGSSMSCSQSVRLPGCLEHPQWRMWEIQEAVSNKVSEGDGQLQTVAVCW